MLHMYSLQRSQVQMNNENSGIIFLNISEVGEYFISLGDRVQYFDMFT